MPTSSNKRIAKNAALLYVRKIITIFIGLYTSRLLLHTLGIDDYGLYGVAGSAVILFGALRSLFTGSIQRYINIAKGRGLQERVSLIFSYGVALNACLCVVFLICTEIGGLVIFPRLNLSQTNLQIAYWILQFSILSSIISMMTTPYDAVMIANERFNAYAWFSIITSVLNLAGVWLLTYLPGRKVVVYAGITFITALIVRICSAVYCRINFKNEVQYSWSWDKILFKRMTLFSIWNGLGTGGFTLFEEGLNFLLNVFGGLTVNGARSVAVHMRAALNQFNQEALASFKPQAMGAYGQKEMSRFVYLINMCSKFSFCISAVMSFVVAIYAPFIIKLWLGEIPEYSVMFIRIIMIYLMVRGIHNSMELIFNASAKLKQYQIWETAMYVLFLPVGWLMLRCGYPFYSVFIVSIMCLIFQYMGDFFILKKYVGYNVKQYLHDIVVPCLSCGCVLIFVGVLWICYLPKDRWFYNVIGILSSSLLGIALCIYMVFNRNERASIWSVVFKRMRHS